MPQIMLTCPNCRYEAPAYSYARLDNNMLKCRRCRGSFVDPEAYKREISYSDTDSSRVVNHFPFELNGLVSEIHVPDGYLAYVVGTSEQRGLLRSGIHKIESAYSNIQVYYICLNPRVIWGSTGINEFGVYGTAQLALTEEYVQDRLIKDSNFLYTLEDDIKKLLCDHMSAYVKKRMKQVGAAVLIQQSGYDGAYGILTNGVRLLQVYPQGYRNAGLSSNTIASAMDYYDTPDVPIMPERIKSPVTIEKIPIRPYTIAKGCEEVFLYSANRYERHKAGEQIDIKLLSGIKQLIKFTSKEFDFPYGWGIYKQTCALGGTYSANGTISFYVDSTYKMGTLVAQSGDFDRFSEQFFNDVLRKELAEKLKPLISRLSSRQGFDVSKINSSLSALSVDLVDALNGEGNTAGQNVFMRYGLRVSRLDILDICFNSYGRWA